MDEKIAEFVKYLQDERHLSVNTLMSYQRDLGQTVSYLRNQGVDKWADVDQYLIIGLLNDFQQHHKSNATLNRLISSLRQFYKYMIRRHYLTVNPMEMIDHQYTITNRKVPVILSEKEIEQLIDVPDTSTPLGIRDRALLEVMDATGMKVSEVITLPLAALHLDVSLLRLTDKNERERMIPLSQLAVKWLNKYIADARPILIKDNKTDFVFVNAHGHPLTRQGIWKKMKRMG